MECLKQETFIFLWFWRLEVWDCFVSMVGFLWGLSLGSFLGMCTWRVREREWGGRGELSRLFLEGHKSYRIHRIRAPPLWPHFISITSLKASLQIQSHLGLSLQRINFGGIQFSAQQCLGFHLTIFIYFPINYLWQMCLIMVSYGLANTYISLNIRSVT